MYSLVLGRYSHTEEDVAKVFMSPDPRQNLLRAIRQEGYIAIEKIVFVLTETNDGTQVLKSLNWQTTTPRQVPTKTGKQFVILPHLLVMKN